MKFIERIKEEAKKKKMRIILPESMDERILEAASIIYQEKIADIILIGDEKVLKTNKKLSGITIINPITSNLTENYVNQLYDLRREKGMTKEEARTLLIEDYMYFACMLVLNHQADGIVSGACHSSSNTLRPALQLIKTLPGTKLVSGFFWMDVPNNNYGENGLFLFADCGLNQNPTSSELAEISGTSAKTFEEFLGKVPYVALLSHSTKRSARHENVEKVVLATKIAQEKYPQYYIDGELQLDSAIVPEVAKMKAPDSKVAGKANVLIFPDLDSGNIGYKLVQRLAGAEAYGPLTQGMRYPVNDLSRGCSVDDIVGVVAITVVQAQKNIQNQEK